MGKGKKSTRRRPRYEERESFPMPKISPFIPMNPNHPKAKGKPKVKYTYNKATSSDIEAVAIEVFGSTVYYCYQSLDQ